VGLTRGSTSLSAARRRWPSRALPRGGKSDSTSSEHAIGANIRPSLRGSDEAISCRRDSIQIGDCVAPLAPVLTQIGAPPNEAPASAAESNPAAVYGSPRRPRQPGHATYAAGMRWDAQHLSHCQDIPAKRLAVQFSSSRDDLANFCIPRKKRANYFAKQTAKELNVATKTSFTDLRPIR
jgi:hypothetical protein